MPGLSALERKKAAFLTGASSCTFARRPRALFGKILRSQFGPA